METKIKIRPVKNTDVKDLQKNIYSRDSLNQVEHIVNTNLEEMKQGLGVHLVAEINGEVVGNIKVVFNQHVLKKHRAALFDVVVAPSHQRKGITRLLLNECKKLCLKKKISILEIYVRGGTPAETVYNKLGFIQYGKLPQGLKEPWDNQKMFDDILFYMDLNKD